MIYTCLSRSRRSSNLKQLARRLGACVLALAPISAQAHAQTAFESDDFNVCGGPAARWTAVDPLGYAQFSIEGAGTSDAKLAIDLAPGVSTDAWHVNLAPRLMQACSDEDFVAELKLDSLPSQRYQTAGLLVEQDAQNWLRFDYYSDGQRLWCYTGSTVSGQTVMVRRVSMTPILPLYLRVSRTGDTWLHERSTDGQNWTTHATFGAPLIVTSVGPFAANAGPAPAFHAAFDYLFEASAPLIPEDGTPNGGSLNLATSTLGLGTGTILVAPNPVGGFACGELVTLNAVADLGFEFTGWSGDLTGIDNPAVIVMEADAQVFARFDPVGPPVISNLLIDVSAPGATITWNTNKPATSDLNYGTTATYGDQLTSGELSLTHEFHLNPLLPGTTYHFEAVSTGTDQQSASSGDQSFQTSISLGPETDDFNRCGGLSPRWTLVDPLGSAQADTVGAGTSDARLRITIPAGLSHDAWGANTATRVMQTADDQDFEIEVSFESIVTAGYQMQGLLVEESPDHWLRFDFYSDGTRTRAMTAKTVGGTSQVLSRTTVADGVPLKLKVTRVADTWQFRWSANNGLSWTLSSSINYPLAVSKVGLFAGSAGVSPPGMVLEADYLWRTDQSILGEDLAPSGGPFALTTHTVGVGAGTVTYDPQLAGYDCGSQVTITATPNAGSTFGGWQGELSGQPNPATLMVGADLAVIARFDSTAPAVISNLAVNAGTTAAECTWTTDKLATSRVDYGTTAALGQVAQVAGYRTQHALSITGLEDGVLYYYSVTSVDGQGQTTTTTIDTFTTQHALGPVSDDFNHCEGLSSIWSFEDPVGGAGIDIVGAATGEATLRMTLPANVDRDAWGENHSTRILQPANDADFHLEVAFKSLLTAGYQMQGLLIEAEADHWLRFDFFHNGSQTRVFAAQTVTGQSSAVFNQLATSGVPLRMRVQRTGNSWTQTWSDDSGATWKPGAVFSHVMPVTKVGLFAGAQGLNAPWTLEADYFFELGTPIAVEDGPIDGGPFTIELPIDGSVVIDPEQAFYDCGQVVTITAMPAAGTIFDNWSGAFAGQGEVIVLRMGSDLVLSPVFIPTPAPTISVQHVAAGSSTAVVSWQTNLPADSRVEYGPTSAYGFVATAAALTHEHAVSLFGLTPESIYHYRVISASDSGAATISDDGTFVTAATGGSLSTDFSSRNLNLSRWSFFQDPRGDSELRMEGSGTSDAHLVLQVAAGVTHDVWQVNNGARALQLIDDIDLDVAVKMESVFTSSYQMQGIVFVGQEDSDFVRFDFFHDGNNLVAFAASTVDGVPQARIHHPIWTGPWNGEPTFLRVKRVGDTWTVFYSLSMDESQVRSDSSWTLLGSFQHAANLTAIGPFAGNAGNAPAFTGRFDWFFSLPDPVLVDDSAPVADQEAPRVYRDSVFVGGPSSAEVRWLTDEQAYGGVEYGLTTDYELGEVLATTAKYKHQILLNALQPNTTYHYRVFADDGTNVAIGSDRTFMTIGIGEGGPGPIVDLWYAVEQPDGSYVQSFGHNGIAQSFCNILGNVHDARGPIHSIKYSLNGGVLRTLTTGPDGRRLLRDGDFNIDLPLYSLNEGPNTVLIVTEDQLQNETQVSLRVDYTSTIEAADGTIQWDAVQHLTDVTQVIDGKWEITGGKLRAVEQGYDRFVAFGDRGWSDYEVEVPVTVHEVDPAGFIFPSNYPLVGFALRWPGHSHSSGQPFWKYWPMGALAAYRWDTLTSGGYAEMSGNFNTTFSSFGMPFPLGVEHTLKARVTTNPDGSTDYKFKVWQSSQPEGNWTIELSMPAGDPLDPDSNPAVGSIGLLSHHVDAFFGDVILTRYDD